MSEQTSTSSGDERPIGHPMHENYVIGGLGDLIESRRVCSAVIPEHDPEDGDGSPMETHCTMRAGHPGLHQCCCGFVEGDSQ